MIQTPVRRGALVLGALSSALLMWTPIADADDPTDCAQLPPEQVQQCQQQQGAGIANRAIDETKNGLDQAGRAADQGQKSVDLSDKNCWLINGVPTMWSPALSTGPYDKVDSCYVVYHLTPH